MYIYIGLEEPRELWIRKRGGVFLLACVRIELSSSTGSTLHPLPNAKYPLLHAQLQSTINNIHAAGEQVSVLKVQ